MNQEIDKIENNEEYKKALIKKYIDAEFDNPIMITLPTIILSAGALAISLLSLSTKNPSTDIKIFVIYLILAIAIGLIVSVLGFYIWQYFLKKKIFEKLKQAKHYHNDTLDKALESATQ